MDTETLYRQYEERDYALFSAKLTKNHDLPYRGIRIPTLRKLAKGLDEFPFEIKYHEDVLLRGFWIASRKIPFKDKIALLESQFPLLSTWDEVDTLASSLKPKKNELDDFYNFFFPLLEDSRPMVRRLGIVTLMSTRKFFDDKREEMLDAIVKADSDEYYVSMAVAWALSFFYIDHSDTEKWITSVSPTTRKRTEQKIRDSRRTKDKPGT